MHWVIGVLFVILAVLLVLLGEHIWTKLDAKHLKGNEDKYRKDVLALYKEYGGDGLLRKVQEHFSKGYSLDVQLFALGVAEELQKKEYDTYYRVIKEDRDALIALLQRHK
jgi:hypothetical protein